MKTIKKLFPIQFVLLAIAVLSGMEVTFKYAHAQGVSGGASEWQDADLGEITRPAGGVQADDGGRYILTSSGKGIWGKTDSFNFMYQPLDGDGELVARVLGLQGTNQFIKAGVMVRESLGADARNAMMLTTLGAGDSFQWRASAGQNVDRTRNVTNSTAPYWVKIVRSGEWLGGYASIDGINWKLVDWRTITGLAPRVYVGLALANYGAGLASAAFDQVAINPVSADVLSPVIGSGDGLRGSYFDNRHLFGQPVTNRVDPAIDFNFTYMLPQNEGYRDRCLAVLGMPKGYEYSIRWVGELQAQFSEPYTLSFESDDGARVWLNEQLIIDDWCAHTNRENIATVDLVAGQKYLLRVEYFQNHWWQCAKFRWSSPSTSKRVVPQGQLYSEPTDLDGNGLPDLWEQNYFGQTGIDPQADSDGDGLSNLQEWRLHRNPTSPMSWGVPNEWTHGDIEQWMGSNGDAHYSNGIFNVGAYAAKNIYIGGDNLHYLYQAIGTNGELVVHLLGIDGTNKVVQAGVMVREDQSSEARNAFLFMAPGRGISYQWREREKLSGHTYQSISETNLPAPCWLKIVRYNDWIGGYVSADGTIWSLSNWTLIKGLSTQALIGMAVTANEVKGRQVRVAARFDQVRAGVAVPDEVMSPVVGDGNGLLGSYRNDSLLYLPGLTNRTDPILDFRWVHDPPYQTLNPDSYGVCWTGELEAQFSEPCTFILGCRREDWVRLWINDQLIIDGWRKWHNDTAFKGTINLTAGKRCLIRVEMFNNHGRGQAQLWWSSPSMPKRLVSQNQLYSKPLDADGNGLPDTWEILYFGQKGVSPGADPDGDGLSNLQEYQYHTNPLKADTDGDGIPDAWEVAHGLDPQFNDAGLDCDHSGWSNLQKYLYGLDPQNPDVDGDGIPDSLEVGYLDVDINTPHADLASETVSVAGAQATNYLGRWQLDGADIFALDRRGGLDFNLNVSHADKYVLNIVGAQNQPNPFENKFKLLLNIDGQTLGHHTLKAGYGTNGTAGLVLPYLSAGSHTLQVFWDGVASDSGLRIKQVKLLAVSGADDDHNGIKDWADTLIASESGLEQTNLTLLSYTSPLCLEGRDPYPVLMAQTTDLTNVLSPIATSDGRWYVDVPLSAGTQTVFQADFQNHALKQTRQLHWQQLNLLTATNSLTIRKGDSLWLTALPPGAVNGSLKITYGTNTYSGKAAKGITCKFSASGTYTVTGTYTPASGVPQTRSITVQVVQQNLPNVEPAAWTLMQRNLNLAGLVPEAVLQADSRLTCTLAGTNANGGTQLSLCTEENEPLSIIARLGTNGPVLDSIRVQGFDVWSAGQTYTKRLQVYPDGSQLVEMLIIASPVNPNVTFVLSPIVGGVIFEDGTTVKTLTATDFDVLGQCMVRFIRPASARTSVCHSIKAYQGNYQIGYKH